MYKVILFQNLKCYVCWFRNLTAAWIYDADVVATVFESTLILFHKVLLLVLLIFMLLTSLAQATQLENEILQI